GITPGSRDIVEAIQTNSIAFMSSTGLAFPLVAAASKAVSFLSTHRDLITGLQERTLLLKQGFRDIGFSMPETPVPILSVTYGDEAKNERLRTLLLKNGIYPPFIHYPGSPPGGHFRFILTSATTSAQEELLVETVRSSL
ncbi:MAG: aminotransferase class I/II-fold pyridoxal phosphate-dependent enzyme, partial [Desulfobacterales bacterium]|nr:aminotransferase class I/II-fold pyridoxal phosphate-dependent enzyme [Desulfobacterales bacterium]